MSNVQTVVLGLVLSIVMFATLVFVLLLADIVACQRGSCEYGYMTALQVHFGTPVAMSTAGGCLTSLLIRLTDRDTRTR